MRTSGLVIGLIAVLLSSAVAFTAGYLLGGEDKAPAPAPQVEVARNDTPPEQPQLPETPRVETPAPDTVTPAPGDPIIPPAETTPDTPTHEARAGVPADEVNTPKPAPAAPADSNGARAAETEAKADDLKRKLDEARAGLADLDVSSIMGGPKVDFTGTILGTVTDPSGVPMAGAEVRGTFTEQFTAGSSGSAIAFSTSRGDQGERLATTDGAGNYRIDVNRQVGEKATLRVSLTAHADGFAESAARTVTLKNGETQENVALALRMAGVVTGRVVDSSGRGVSGVTVNLQQGASGASGGIVWREGGASTLSATTDGGGEYRIERVPEGRYTLQVVANGYREVSGPSSVNAKPGTETRVPTDFILEVTASVRVTVQSMAGTPIEGAFLTLYFRDASGQEVKKLMGRADKDGVVVINDPPIGTFDVELKLWKFKPQIVPATVTERLPCDLGTLVFEQEKIEGPIEIDD